MSNQAPGLNEYEKSVFLTQAQEALVLDIYTGNNTDSFESTEAATEAINMLVREASPKLEKSSSEFNGISIYSATLPEDLWYKTGELAEMIPLNVVGHLQELWMSYQLHRTGGTGQ